MGVTGKNIRHGQTLPVLGPSTPMGQLWNQLVSIKVVLLKLVQPFSLHRTKKPTKAVLQLEPDHETNYQLAKNG